MVFQRYTPWYKPLNPANFSATAVITREVKSAAPILLGFVAATLIYAKFAFPANGTYSFFFISLRNLSNIII